ncbi:serine/threonine protein kinase [Streptomyces sp. IMTB 2501]|uniref:serine/threonine-protein kinase n=1 Tax=Streptomyces sp. IMTB 2501 TaxID=1776340 RepID=UPI00096DABB7|nr:serine/threonine-protein kinase [Streptomyces sp. IMTB 2501]OLZ72669.1 serine/threonine protein kinase [Streptomyces sp. IMTB 2501]
MSEEPGRERVIAGRYRLLSALGEGGMGTVWRARDEVLHREVAVKEVRAPAGLPAADVERMYARLEREAWAAARVSNRNVVTVYDVALEGGRPWIVMELVRGLSLADQLEAEGPPTPQRAAHIGAEVLSALRAAHAVGVLHRDVKPANVLLANDGRVVLTDFGIASVEGSSALTMTGEVVGSPEFLAPERALGRTPGPESDLWSLGVLLYAAVEGVSPFRYDTPISTLRAVVDEELPPPRRAGPLAPVIEGLLRKDPAERLDAERAEHELRIVAAGGALSGEGTPRAATMPLPPPYIAPTAVDREYATAYPQPPSPTPPALSGTTTSAAPGRPRRAGVVLVAGLLAVLLALAGLTYALLHRDNGGGRGNAGGASASDSAHAPTARDSTDSNTGTPSAASTSASPSTQPAQSVQVTVAGAHTTHSGTCPPPAAQTPAFTATFTVGRLPARVEYRWVSTRGSVSDPGWRTLPFPAGGGRTQKVRVTLTVYSGSGTTEDQISVKVRGPVRMASNSVPFSVSCSQTATETPTGGASASASGSPGSSP